MKHVRLFFPLFSRITSLSCSSTDSLVSFLQLHECTPVSTGNRIRVSSKSARCPVLETFFVYNSSVLIPRQPGEEEAGKVTSRDLHLAKWEFKETERGQNLCVVVVYLSVARAWRLAYLSACVEEGLQTDMIGCSWPGCPADRVLCVIRRLGVSSLDELLRVNIHPRCIST